MDNKRQFKKDCLKNEEELVRMAKTDDNAFQTLYNYYFPEILGYIYKRVGSKEVTEDLVSVIFIKVFTNLNKYKSNSFRAWLYRIATNSLIDYYRKNSRVSEINIEDVNEPQSIASTPIEDVQKKQDMEMIKDILNSLPQRYKEILHLKFFSELNIEEISKVMDISVGNVSAITNRALKKFHQKSIKI